MKPFDADACENRFVDFFTAIHGHPPFPWQTRLAVRVCDPDRGWPKAIALPTAAGKTAGIDIAVFALAMQTRKNPRRIFFVVDRRIVVDQAYSHAEELARILIESDDKILRDIADRLREIASPGWMKLPKEQQQRVIKYQREMEEEKDFKKRRALRSKIDDIPDEWIDTRPLDYYALRGGMYREDTWVRSPLQPTVITSTVDQVGSRLLFRGYGVSDSMKPIHAGLVGNDALILLDEAHCSLPFAETAAAVQKYRGWKPSLAPFEFVQMTATPTSDVPEKEIERDHSDDRSHPFLGKRLKARKPAMLVVSEKAKGKTWAKWGPPLVATLAEQARKLMGQKQDAKDEVRSVGIIVNRVATARALRAELAKEDAKVILLTGRMRPLDRDRILKELEPLFTAPKKALEQPTYVVATQCLEVGADLDFHALVSECASLDALRQRFGRLNRHAQERTFAPGCVVIRGDQTEDTEDDPVYGSSLANTWKWLMEKATDNAFDFGVTEVRKATEGVDLTPLNAPREQAPILLPAHIDCWVQTAPRPTPDPDPAIFLHGSQKPGIPDVQVVFRNDLGPDETLWSEVVSLCPPSSSEALPVRLDVFKRWLANEDTLPDSLADSEGEGDASEEEETPALTRTALRWEGPEKSELLSKDGRVQPRATYIVPADATGIDMLGDFPNQGPPADYGEEAFRRSRDRAVLRLRDFTADREADDFEEQLTAAIQARLTEDSPEWDTLSNPRLRTVADYPDPLAGVVVTGKKRLGQFRPAFADDESSESPVQRQVTLEDHTRGVMSFAERFAKGCGLATEMVDRFLLAARWHDLGKADPRFQALLRGGSPRTAARMTLLAKSGAAPSTPREREAARAVHLYPKGGRHELLSLSFASERTDDDAILHLIATHHGDGRPFANAYLDDTRGQVEGLLPDARLFEGESYVYPKSPGDPTTANILGPDRFWRFVREHGWWGSAYLESIFRLADHTASREEQRERWTPEVMAPVCPAHHLTRSADARFTLPLPGLEGSNPLGFLAAVGLLHCLSKFASEQDAPEWLSGGVRLSWGSAASPLGAMLQLASEISEKSLCAYLAERLQRDIALHPAALAVKLAEGKDTEALGRYQEFRQQMTSDNRDPSDWAAAHFTESLPEASSQLLIVRSDYLRGNVVSVMERTEAEHLQRTLFCRWDYSDALDNQSLHWEPSEDRRHAYQWHQPNGDPTKKRRGGMLGANRLGLEAWPLFLSVPHKGKLQTRGFKGTRSRDTFWTWPLWSWPASEDAVVSLMSLPELQESDPSAMMLKTYGVQGAFRCQRILVGKTPNLTPASAVS